MSYSSWLKKVKRLEDLSSHLIEDYDSPHWKKISELSSARFFELIHREPPVDEKSKKFFCARLHDSWIFNIERTKDEVYIKIHSFLAEIFASDVCEFAGIPQPNIHFPVILKFEDVVYANGFRSNSEKKLVHSNWLGSLHFSFELTTSSTLRYDWFYEQEGRLQWICELWSYLPSAGKLDQHSLFVVVDCGKASAMDLREYSLAKIFPPEIMYFWRDIVNGVDFPQKHNLEGAGLPMSYILNRLDKYNLNPNQLIDSIRSWQSENHNQSS